MQSKLHAKIAVKKSLRNKCNKPQRKRALKRNTKIKNQMLKIFGINAAGITSKIDSFDKMIFDRSPAIWMMHETKEGLVIQRLNQKIL